jgi:hypothetical protein
VFAQAVGRGGVVHTDGDAKIAEPRAGSTRPGWAARALWSATPARSSKYPGLFDGFIDIDKHAYRGVELARSRVRRRLHHLRQRAVVGKVVLPSRSRTPTRGGALQQGRSARPIC